jgi:hypothetical protein
MKTQQIIDQVTNEGSLELTRFEQKHYVLRKQCKRLVTSGVLACETKAKSFLYTKNFKSA